MKKLKPTLFVKELSFILCILFFLITIACAFCAVTFWEKGFYLHSETYFRQELPQKTFSSDAFGIMEYYLSAIRPISRNFFSYSDTDSPYRLANTNLHYQLIGPTGFLLLYNDSRFPYNVENAPLVYSFTLENGHLVANGSRSEGFCYTVIAYVDSNYPVTDEYSEEYFNTQYGYSLRYTVLSIGIIALILFLTAFVILMWAAGCKANSNDLFPGPFHKIPTDVYLGILTVATLFAFALMERVDRIEYPARMIFLGALYIAISALILGACMGIAVRIKSRTLFRNTLTWWFLRFSYTALKATGNYLPLIWKAIILLLLVTGIEFIFIVTPFRNASIPIFWWVIEKALLLPLGIYTAISLQKLQKGGEALASGELTYQTDTKYLVFDFKRHAENLNHIGEGMNVAVEKRLQSERMKTELITNISHDIKTPITSIMNYAGLIASSPCDSPLHAEYAEVLTRKSERLKHLLDDLVEISKATTGNLELELLPCQADVLLSQVSGEYETRLQDANLQLVIQEPEEELTIRADSRKIWRVFDNLMNNAVKYALPGTRVYLSLVRLDDHAVFTIRNISRDQLSVTPQELLERFVRGDSSRTSDGNGLGLSIVQTLTDRMGGSLQLDIDGDLFKVTLSFPLVQ